MTKEENSPYADVNIESKIELWEVSKLIPYEKNFKNHAPEQIDALVANIERTGWDVPIVINAEGVIGKGHGRRLAAIQLGLVKVPVIVRRDLTDEEFRLLRVSDNSVSDMGGGYDKYMMNLELSDLASFEGIDLEITGLDWGDTDDFTFTEGEDVIVGDPSESAPSSKPSVEPVEEAYKPVRLVTVTCETEADQQRAYELMTEQGFKCRIQNM